MQHNINALKPRRSLQPAMTLSMALCLILPGNAAVAAERGPQAFIACGKERIRWDKQYEESLTGVLQVAANGDLLLSQQPGDEEKVVLLPCGGSVRKFIAELSVKARHARRPADLPKVKASGQCPPHERPACVTMFVTRLESVEQLNEAGWPGSFQARPLRRVDQQVEARSSPVRTRPPTNERSKDDAERGAHE